MNDSKFLCMYLRKTNGSGQKITINSLTTSKQLHGYIAQIFNISQKSFELYSKGVKLPQNSDKTLQSLSMQQGGIIHVREKDQTEGDKILLRVFCKGSLYSYQTTKNSTINDLKFQMVGILGCNINDIVVTHLGTAINNQQTFEHNQIKNKDLISVIISPSSFYQRSSTRLKPKIAESLTFAPSDQIDQYYQPFVKEVMRKSSMKSSHQSRELRVEQSKKLLQVIRPKSQKANNEQVPDQQNLNLLKLPWLSSQKMIQTESINFDDPEMEQELQQWKQCSIELSNKQSTIFLTIECYPQNDIWSVLRVVARALGKQSKNIELTFPDENLQRRAESGDHILQIAKQNKTKIIHNIIFN